MVLRVGCRGTPLGILCSRRLSEFENGRWSFDVRRVAEALNAPEPFVLALVIVPEQAQGVTIPVGVTENRAVEVNVLGVTLHLLLPRFGNEVLVLPEREEHVCVQPDLARRLQALELLLALDRPFPFPEHRHQMNLVQVQFGKCDGELVPLIHDDGPTRLNEGSRVEAVTDDRNHVTHGVLLLAPRAGKWLSNCPLTIIHPNRPNVNTYITLPCPKQQNSPIFRAILQNPRDALGF